MTNKNKNKKDNAKKEPCNCDSCKEIRSLDRLDRVSRWVLGTVKWTYDYGYIFGSGALNSDSAHPVEKFEKLDEAEKKYLIETCSQAYKNFKKYQLFYVCYLFGAYFQQCKRHKIKFKFEKDFLMTQLLNFRKMVEKFYKEPNKKANVWLPMLDDLFGKKDLDLNKNFFLALLPPLANQQLEYIVDWFIKNRKEQVVENIFYSAAHYLHLELDENSSFYKIKIDGETIDALSFKLSQKDFKGFDKSILPTETPIRYSFVYLALSSHEELKDLFVKSNQEDKFLNQLISIGPDVAYQAQEFNKV